MSAGLVLLVSAVFALQFLLWPASAEAGFHKTLQNVAKDPGRAGECAQGDTKVVKKIVGNTIKNAKDKYNLDGLVTSTDTKRAEKELYQFLDWKIGSPSAVCAQYVSAGQKHFDKGYSDEAAAALLGLELPGEGRAQFKLPKKTSDQLKAQIKACVQQQGTTPPAQGSQSSAGAACQQQMAQLKMQLQQQYGVPPQLTDMAAKQVADAGVKAVDRVGFNMPKSWDVENSLVQKLIADRRAAQ